MFEVDLFAIMQFFGVADVKVTRIKHAAFYSELQSSIGFGGLKPIRRLLF